MASNMEVIRRRFIVYAILFLPAFALALALFPLHRIFSDEDVLLQFYPYAAFLSRSLHAGTSLIFSNALLNGFPLGATMNGGFFNPLHLAVFRLTDFMAGYHALTIF